ncbi:glycosyltransferase family 4 protein [Cyclobacteriaceae bacterium]|nr:glycosyltransferase family 4 protein [Cyclobacteriaceae bacterium]
MKRILFTGELPMGSINGVAISNGININILKTKFSVSQIVERVEEPKYKGAHLEKITFNFNRVLSIILITLKYKFNFFYLVYSNSKAGALKTYLLILAFKLFGQDAKIIVHLHRGDIKRQLNSLIGKSLFKLNLRLIDKFIVLSDADLNFLENNYGKQKTQIIVLRNIINASQYFKSKEQLSNNNKFIFISNYIIEKGILDLLDSFSGMEKPLSLKCYGGYSGDIRPKDLASYQSDNILISGPIYGEEKFKAIYDADCLILPSHNEGMPLILLETMSLGVPFIARSVGHVREMIYENYPFLYNRAEELGEMIQTFSSLSITERNALGKQVRDHYSANFDRSNHEKKMLSIFEHDLHNKW